MSTKTKAKKSNGKSAKNGSANGHKAAGARSAKQGGHVPAARYAKDPKAVVARLKEKAESAGTQAANAIVRAEKNEIKDANTKKLEAGLKHFEAAAKALA